MKLKHLLNRTEDCTPHTSNLTFYAKVIASLGVVFVSYFLNLRLIIPSDVLDVEKIKNTYAPPPSAFAPESHEFKRLVFYIVLICVLSLFFTLLYKKIRNRLFDKFVEVTGLVLFFFSIAIVAFALFHSFNFQEGFYIELLSIVTNPFWTIVVLENVFIACYIYKKLKVRYPKIKYVMYLFDVAIIFVICRLLARDVIFLNLDNEFFSHHFAVVYNPIYELACGRTPGVDFQSLYGLNCYWFYYVEVLFFGRVSAEATAWLMGALACVVTVLLYYSIYRMFKSRPIAFIATVGIVAFCVLVTLLYTNTPYFQYFPIRVIIPVCVLFFITMFHTSKIKKARALYFPLAALSAAFGVLWNPETGGVSLLALIAYFAYDSFSCFGTLKSKGFWVRIGKATSVMTISFAGAIAVLEIVTKIRTGQFVDFMSIFWGIKIFAGDGFFMLPLPEVTLLPEISVHPFVIVLGIYSVTVICTIFDLFSKPKRGEGDFTNALGFVSAVLGFGLFTYYLGRSHVQCFVVCVWPAFFCTLFLARKCFYFCHSHFVRFKNSEIKISKMVVPAICGLISAVAFFSIFVCAATFYTVRSSKEYMAFQRNNVYVPSVYQQNMEFLEAHKTSSMMVLDGLSMFYLSDIEVKNEYAGPARIDYFLLDDYYNEMEQVKAFKGRLFMRPHDRFSEFTFPDGETYAQKYDRIIQEHFTLLKDEGGWLIYESIN